MNDLLHCPDCERTFETVRELTDHITDWHQIPFCLDTGANRKSLDPEEEHHSPLDQGSVNVGGSGIMVRLIGYPAEEGFKRAVYKATLATRGSDVDKEEAIDRMVIEDAFKGGLNQCLEWATIVFEISGVSRGLTHELVRTRKASFSQQSMRHTNMGGNPNMRMPTSIWFKGGAQAIWLNAAETCKKAYAALVEMDVPYQDARTILPIATETYIIAEYPLSEFLATYSYRSCYMFYPEIVYLFRLMRKILLKSCPWLEPYILTTCEKGKKCNYQGWERVEGHCPMPWAIENQRTWKSRKFDK